MELNSSASKYMWYAAENSADMQQLNWKTVSPAYPELSIGKMIGLSVKFSYLGT